MTHTRGMNTVTQAVGKLSDSPYVICLSMPSNPGMDKNSWPHIKPATQLTLIHSHTQTDKHTHSHTYSRDVTSEEVRKRKSGHSNPACARVYTYIQYSKV